MLIVRTIREEDLDGLLALAAQVGPGMTTLKPDRKTLARRVEIACASFADQIEPAQRDYVFVMEESETRRLVGVCGIKGAVGLDEPFYNYRIGTLVHSSNELKVFSRMDTLYLSNDLTGCAELCSLFLHPDFRSGSNGKLLSKSRFLFIAQFPHLFPEKLIAEMRGYQREDGTSPFWDSLGQHFFRMDFNRADDLSSLGQKSFIAELMPKYPLYVAYLPQEAQQVIGRVHVATAPARHLLEQEGMHYEGYVDIFDAGPVLQARVIELRALRESSLAVVDAKAGAAYAAQQPFLLASTRMAGFRVTVADIQPEEGRIGLSEPQKEALAVGDGDTVRTMALNPKKVNHA
ncbi:arginine N-succinyltransferase [Noviherbaspirillum sp. CPCC 100848]|uniref:Arginine N-succinyltransferase n=1 Tax=Noviherbaspirillum album TaxID=3080276 RepID=A0ABU6J8W3_9BURK|nr:arginine N-succinyltransferase [Noviherbaspirillum sp. CPCC 100848]MEC4719624.1 arginine N-succinyltransferase [Noviherbaspirillum sp. CPCC 100848]